MILLWHGASKLFGRQALALLVTSIEWTCEGEDIQETQMLRSVITNALAICQPLLEPRNAESDVISSIDIVSIWHMGLSCAPTDLFAICKYYFLPYKFTLD